MKKELQDAFAEVQTAIDAVVGHTKKFTRAEAIEFCEEVQSHVEGILESMEQDEEREKQEAGA